MSENGTCLTSGNPPTPQMTRTAFLQTGGRMAITVTGLTVSETYRIGFVMARRGNYNAHLGRTFTVTMGGQNLGMYSPMTTTWEQALTAAVVANATSLQLVIEAGAEPGIDSTALIDDVAVMGARPHAARAMGSANTYAYDQNGNMTVRREVSGTQAFVYTQGWTVDNRLASVVKSDVTGTILATTTIAYDGDGVRVKKVDPSGTTCYLGTVEVLITGTTQVTTSYYAFGGAMVAMRTTATATLTYLHGDHLGSTSLTTNASGQKVSEQRYKPYGEVRWSSGAGMPTDKQFTNQTRLVDGYVGTLYDYVARAYDPVLGRFISADTIVPGAGNSQALNRYMYVRGNPLRFTDPTGQFTSDEVNAYLVNQYGTELADSYMKAWKSDAAFWKMLMDANFGDVLFAPTTKLGSGKFTQVGATSAFESESSLERYQGFGPYRLIDRRGNDRARYGEVKSTLVIHAFDDRPPSLTQPLYHYGARTAPVRLPYDRVVSYEGSTLVWDRLAGDSTPWLVTTALIGGAGKFIAGTGWCQGHPACGAVVAGAALLGAAWSGLTWVNNAFALETNLTVSFSDAQQPQFCGQGGLGCLSPVPANQISHCDSDLLR